MNNILRFLRENRIFTIVSILFAATVLLSMFYAPWSIEGADEELEMLIKPYHPAVRMMFSIFWAGFSDLYGMIIYSLFNQNGTNPCLLFGILAMYSIQKIIGDKISDSISCKGTLQTIIVNYMLGNIVFAASAYILYFIHPVFQSSFFTEQSNIFYWIVIVFILLLAIPTDIFLVIYLFLFYMSFSVINFVYASLSIPVVLLHILACILIILIAVLTDMLANKIYGALLERIAFGISCKIPFLSPLYDFLYL